MTLFIRADASTQIGTGHIMRCLALAQAWQAEGGETIFVMATEAPGIEARLHQEGFKVMHHQAALGSEADAAHTIALAEQFQGARVVVDGYHFGAEFQRQLKTSGLRVLFVDDNGHAEHYYADWVLNQNIHAHAGLYTNREPDTQLLLGTRYALLRKEFWPWRGWRRQIVPGARKVLVTLGGSDPDNVTLKIMRVLQQSMIPCLEVVVLVGGSNPHAQSLQTIAQAASVKFELLQNVSNMPDLMAWADIGIASASSVCWELLFMNLPSLVLITAKNQLLMARELDKIPLISNLGWYSSVGHQQISLSFKELSDSFRLSKSSESLTSQIIDGFGVQRVLSALS